MNKFVKKINKIMKVQRRVVSVLILCSIISSIQTYSQGLQLELLVRPALTSITGNDGPISDYLRPTINYSGGVNFNYFLKSKSIVRFGLIYDKKGEKGDFYLYLRDSQNQPIGEGTVTTKLVFNYITIPLQWGQEFGNKIKFQYGIGFYTSLLLKQEMISEGINGLADGKGNDTESFKKIDFGLSGSFSMYIPLNEMLSLKLGLDDNLGLLNFSDVPVLNKNGTLKHNSFGATIGLNIKLK